MKRQVRFRLNWAMPTSLLIIFALVGCQPPSVPTQAPQASSMPEATLTEVAATAPASASPTPALEPTATSQPPGNSTPIQYQDDFTNKGTGWPTIKLDTYLFGYHEPQWYEVEVDNPKTTVPIIPVPTEKKYSYGDATIEVDVNTFPTKTAPEGDFRYGIVFRRSGDNYYAFTISQPTKKWYLFKNSPTGPVSLKEGSEESIHNRGDNDHLRVDLKGPDFFLSINGRQVGQVTDPDYTEGQIGFFVQSIDSKQAHIHFDQLIIRDLALVYSCTFPGDTLLVRSGPAMNSAQVAILKHGDTVEAFGISPDGWIKIKLPGSDQLGWVSYYYAGGNLSCTPSVKLFPKITQ